ncbi:MAG: hypothetical protein LBT71_09215 [Azoarcus sp.]|jgi:hypothetical protein|nr:hypothetical protein [Azoarcus sp.]
MTPLTTAWENPPHSARAPHKPGLWNRPSLFPICSTIFALATLMFCALSFAQDSTQAGAQVSDKAAAADPRAAYQQIELVKLVPVTRMTDGGRAIFEPRPVRFTARLAQLPSPQKADYLKQVMGMMGSTADIQVSQRVALDYGGDKPLAAYVEDKAAARIGKELKAGDARTFYAFHVYNNRYGPALVITSFED